MTASSSELLSRPLLRETTLRHTYGLVAGLSCYLADWPSPDNADRKILLRAGDVLTYDAARESFTKHAGVAYVGIVLPHQVVGRRAGNETLSYVMGSEYSAPSTRPASALAYREAVHRTVRGAR